LGVAARIAELPSGTVTFLFSDVEGSTRLLTRLPSRYAEVLAEHQRLLRAAFESTTVARSTPRVTRSSSRSRGRATPSPPR
jgi:class 3 adenylate cyclase